MDFFHRLSRQAVQLPVAIQDEGYSPSESLLLESSDLQTASCFVARGGDPKTQFHEKRKLMSKAVWIFGLGRCCLL